MNSATTSTKSATPNKFPSDWPKISIITPSYNQGQFIEETILSVLTQSYQNFELIIIDGGSKDNTVDVIKKYKDHITYWVSEPDKGQTDAILKGLDKCTGELFNWINSDDRLAPNSLWAVAEKYIESGRPGLVAGNVEIFDASGNKRVLPHINYRHDLAITLGMGEMRQPGMFYRTDLIKQIKLNPAMHYSMDVDLYFRYNFMVNEPSAVYINQTLAEFRIHDTSKTNQEITKKTDSKFFHERTATLGEFIAAYDNEGLKKKYNSLFPATDNSKKIEVINTNERKHLLRKAFNYFLLENLLEALYVFDKKKVFPLLRSINWFNVRPQFTFRVAGKLTSLFFLFIKNKLRFA